MTAEEFREKYCKMCGSQRCEGIGTDWFNGCSHRNELDAPKLTNADRIRAMSDEELAKFLTDDLCELFCPNIPTVCDGQCETVALDWLRQEVEI